MFILSLYPPGHELHDDIVIVVPPSKEPTTVRFLMAEGRSRVRVGFSEYPEQVEIDRGKVRASKDAARAEGAK